MPWEDPDQRVIRFPLPGEHAHSDWQDHAKYFLRGMPGTLIVVFDRPEEARGDILLPDSYQNHYFSESGRVVASGSPEYTVGDRVLCCPSAGLRFSHFTTHAGTMLDVRAYGITTEDSYMGLKEPLSDPVPAVVTESGEVVPKGDWCLVENDATVTSDGGVLLTKFSSHGTCKGTVVAASSRAKQNGVRVGARFLHHPNGARQAQLTLLNFGDPDKQYSFIKWTDLISEIV